jgi:hypothetical protein
MRFGGIAQSLRHYSGLGLCRSNNTILIKWRNCMNILCFIGFHKATVFGTRFGITIATQRLSTLIFL